MGSDPPIRAKMTTSHIFQSTLPHGERPIVTIEMVKQFSISIHAPAWGATANTTVLREVIQISIHAPAWGATASVGMKAHQIQISIHAPAWGATLFLPSYWRGRYHFNPRSRMGSDIISAFLLAWPVSFQSTLPHGERRKRLKWLPPVIVFQSTLPHGERHRQLLHLRQLRHISIHAPAWGATVCLLSSRYS